MDLKTRLWDGCGVNINIEGFYGAHALTVWGAEYDENGKIVAVYLTDSDDGGSAYEINGKLKAMERRCVYKASNGQARLSTKLCTVGQSYGSKITSISSLKPDILIDGRSAWDKYFNPTPLVKEIV